MNGWGGVTLAYALLSQMMVTSIGRGTGKRGVNNLRYSAQSSSCDRNQFPNSNASSVSDAAQDPML